MIFNRLTTTAIIALAVTTVNAKQLSVGDAMNRAASAIGASGAKGNVANKASMTLAYTATSNGNNTIYAFNSSDGNFVITSADDLAPAVLAYGPGQFKEKEMNDGVKYMIGLYNTAVANAIATGKSLSMTSVSEDVYEPLITTKWGQSEPYNNDCPLVEGSETQHCVTGCVPLSLSMIAHYYQHGGNYNYSLIQTAYDFYMNDDGTYDWLKYTEESAKEMTRLISDIGKGINVTYGADATGGRPIEGINYLIDNFGYDRGAKHIYRSLVKDDEEWQKIILEELKAKRPVEYDASSAAFGGHAFICDGYDGKGYFHINWGWYGQSNGYYLLIGDDALIPNGYYSYGYNQDQSIYIGIQPNVGTRKRETGLAITTAINVVKPDGTVPDTLKRSETLYVTGQITNTGLTTGNHRIGVKLIDEENGNEFWDYIRMSLTDLEAGLFCSSFPFETKIAAVSGKYKVQPIWCPEGKDYMIKENWQNLPVATGTELPEILVKDSLNEEELMIIDKPYVTRIDNKATKKDMTLKVKCKALKDIDVQYRIIGFVLDKDGKQIGMNGYFIATIPSMKANEEKELSMTLNKEFVEKNIKEGETYQILINNYRGNSSGKLAYPNLYTMFDFNVVDEETFNAVAGDANNDKTVNMEDVKTVVDYTLDPTKKVGKGADVDGDGKVTVKDANAIINKIIYND